MPRSYPDTLTDRYSQLEALVLEAPARQVGQPGNSVIGRMIQERFVRAVAEGNADQPSQWNEAQRLLGEARQAEAKIAEAKRQFEQTGQSGQTQDSSWQIHYTFENAWPTSVVFLILMFATFAAWRIHRRISRIIAAGLCAAVAVGVLLAAALVETESERITRSGSGAIAAGLTTALAQSQIQDAGRAALQADIKAAESLRGLWQHGQMRTPSAVFLPGKATIRTDRGEAKLFQMAPNLVEPANLPGDLFDGPLLYAGRGQAHELRPISDRLSQAAVLLEFDCDQRWLSPIRHGARLVIFVEPSPDAMISPGQTGQKISNAPLSIPRFYIRRTDLKRAFGDNWKSQLGQGRRVQIHQREPGRWDRRELICDWLFIPGSAKPAVAGTPLAHDPARQLVHLQTYRDSNCIVPELSPGAGSAANLVLMMRLIDRFIARPPMRPVLMSVVNNHANAMQGEQEFAHFAFADPQGVFDELKWIEQQLARERFDYLTYHQNPTADRLEPLRTQVAIVAGRRVKAKLPVLDRLISMRNVSSERRSQLRSELAQHRSDKAALERQLSEHAQRHDRITKLMQLFNQFGLKAHFAELNDPERTLLTEVFRDIAHAAEQGRDELLTARARLIENLSIRRRLRFATGAEYSGSVETDASERRLFNLRYTPVPATVGFCLDLSFGSEDLGFFFVGSMLGSLGDEAEKRAKRLARHTVAVSADFAHRSCQPNLLEDTITYARGLPWQAHLGGPFAFASSVMQQHKVCALTLTSVRDGRPNAFSPLDTTDRIPPARYRKMMGYLEGYLAALIDDSDLGVMPIEIRQTRQELSIDFSLRMQDRFSADVPKRTVPGALMVAPLNLGPMPMRANNFGQVRPHMILITDGRGAVTLRGGAYRKTAPWAFGYDPDYRAMTAALDLGEGMSQFGSTLGVNPNTRFTEQKLAMSRFAKVDLLGLTSPLTLRPVTGLRVFDAREESTPRHYAVVGVPVQTKTSTTVRVPLANDGTGCVMVEPGSRFKLRFGKAVAVNTEPRYPKGAGYPSDIGTLADMVTASHQDMTALTGRRLKLLSETGVTDLAAGALNKQAAGVLEDAATSGPNDRLARAEEGFGLAFRAYARSQDIMSDLVVAVVIFMALVIPFCFFLMKLVTPFTDINRQIALFGGIFVAMVLVLYFAHPAFAVADTPIVVVLAFVILGLAVSVALILIGRFNSSMMQVVEQALQSESAEAPRSRLAEVAFLVGVNSMKRRRIRTTLTCATIVLVTFTMLSVISVGYHVDPAVVRQGTAAAYDGFVFTRPGMGEISPLTIERLRARYADVNAATVVVRTWGQKLGVYGEHLGFEIALSGAGTQRWQGQLRPKVLLGLEVAEQDLHHAFPVTAGRWFRADDAPEIVLSVEAARLLGITSDNLDRQLTLLGTRLRLVGLVDDERMLQLKDLSQTPVLPLLFEPSVQRQEKQLEVAEAEAEGTLALEAMGSVLDGAGVQVANPVDVAFVPIGTARDLGWATNRTLSVKFLPRAGSETLAKPAAQWAWEEVNRLVRFQHVRVSLGLTDPVRRDVSGKQLGPGEYALTSSTSTQVGGVLKVAIPIVLAATIILNTMLGSVMERKREVAIYNAIGLNPGHVMIFFLAESLVFGIVGSIAGYLIGQVMSIGLTRFNLIELNLNYSSLAVIVVIFLTIGTVLASTIYPAVMAARAAVPSGQRRWSLPRPEGDQIKVDFPFSYDTSHVLGVCAYLYEYMEQNSEASTGKFLARAGPIGFVPAAATDSASSSSEPPRAFTMLFDVAPAPFDLGVNQKMEVYASYSPKVRAHVLSVHLTRASGEKNNWVTVNQPFLEAMRKRLLAWRSQRGQIQQEYFKKGERLFANAGNLPVDESGQPSLREPIS